MALYTILPVHFSVLGLTPIQVGVLLSANRWVRIITNHLAEKTIRHIPPGVCMVLALVAGAVTTAVYGFTPPFLFFLAARLVWGMSWSFLRQIGVMNTVENSAKGQVGKMLGVYNGAVRIGFVIGNFAGGLLFDALGFRLVFLLMAAFSVAGVIPAVAGMKWRNRGQAVHNPGPIPGGGKTADLLIYARGFLIGTVGSGIIMSTLGHVLSERMSEGISIGSLVIGIATVNGILLALRQTLHVIGSPFLGTFIDRAGVYRSQLFLFAAATATLFTAFFRIHAGLLVTMVVVFFMSETALQLGLMVQAGMRGSKQYARLATAMDLGSAVGPIAGWTAVGLFLSSRWTFLIGSAFYLLGTLFTLMQMLSNKGRGEQEAGL